MKIWLWKHYETERYEIYNEGQLMREETLWILYIMYMISNNIVEMMNEWIMRGDE